MKKILIFENDPQYFESTYLYKWLIKNKITAWDLTNEANANYTALAVNNLHEYSGCNFKLTNNKKTNYYETVCNNDFTGTSFTKSCKHKFA